MVKEFRILALCTVCIALCSLSATAQETPTQAQVLSDAVANEPVHFDVSRPLIESLAEAPTQQVVRQTHPPMKTKHPSPGVRFNTSAVEPLIGPLVSDFCASKGEGQRSPAP